jgi:hypothetical protein
MFLLKVMLIMWVIVIIISIVIHASEESAPEEKRQDKRCRSRYFNQEEFKQEEPKPTQINDKPENKNALFVEYLRSPKQRIREYPAYRNKWPLYKNSEPAHQNGQSYTPKKPMTQTESTLYFRLVDALGGKYIILPQVQMSSFLEIKARDYREYYKKLNPILMKSIDFLIIEKSGKTVAAIELQDWTHKREDRKASDKFKRETLKDAKIPFIEFHAENLPSIKTIRQSIDNIKSLKDL